jgi:serine/threonine protein kinase
MENSSTWPGHQDKGQSPDNLIGLMIDGRYLVQKELAHGGVGAVYLSHDTKLLNKPVVIKILLEKSLTDQWVVQKFQQEKEALARVDHPGVVGILDTGELPNGKPYLVMQFVNGPSLRDAMNETPDGMDLQRVATIVKQIASALSAVHAKGIYHRDLKPENIMLQTLGRGTEQVKIVDFGIAKIKESLIAPSTVTGAATAGTIRYMSPEQLRGIKVTAASDIYSFGVIVYEMVTGRRPFNPATIGHLSDLQREGVQVRPTALRPQLPVDAENAILKALSFDQSNRYKHAVDFSDVLATALLNEETTLRLHNPANETLVDSFEPSAADKVTPASPAQPKRWPRIAIGIAAGLVLLAGAGLIALLLSFGGQNTVADSENVNRPVVASQRSLNYSLTVQKMRDGKPYQDTFESSGQEIFESGYKFRLNVSSPQSGFLYVFNQSVDEQSGHLPVFSSIYPTPKTNQGSAWLNSNSTVQTNWNQFGGQPDTERFWIVWSNSAVSELEAAKNVAFNSAEGMISDMTINESLQQFLLRHSEPRPVTIKDTASKQTAVRGEGDLLVKLLELEHR